MVGSIPTEMQYLTALRKMDLSKNLLKKHIPGIIFTDLTELQYLALNDNALSGTIPSELWELTNLKTLNLEDNLFDESSLTIDVCSKFKRTNDFMRDAKFCLNSFWTSLDTQQHVYYQFLVWTIIYTVGITLSVLIFPLWRGMLNCCSPKEAFEEVDEDDDDLLDEALSSSPSSRRRMSLASLRSKKKTKKKVDEQAKPRTDSYPVDGNKFLIIMVISIGWAIASFSVSNLSSWVNRSNVYFAMGVVCCILLVFLAAVSCFTRCYESRQRKKSSPSARSAEKADNLQQNNLDKFSCCVLVIQVAVAVIGHITASSLNDKNTHVYGFSLSISGLLGWNFSLLSGVCILPHGSSDWPFLLSCILFPPFCLLSFIGSTDGDFDLYVFWIQLIATLYLAWSSTYYLAIRSMRDILRFRCEKKGNMPADGGNEQESYTDIDTALMSSIVSSAFSKFALALIPSFYFSIDSISNFISYNDAENEDESNGYLSGALISYFLGVVILTLVLSREAWLAAGITVNEVLRFKCASLYEYASFLFAALLSMFSLAIEAQIISNDDIDIYFFLVIIISAPPIQFVLLSKSCQKRLVSGVRRLENGGKIKDSDGDVGGSQIDSLSEESQNLISGMRHKCTSLESKCGALESDVEMLKSEFELVKKRKNSA